MNILTADFLHRPLIISLGKLPEKKILNHPFNFSFTKTVMIYWAEIIRANKLYIQAHSVAKFYLKSRFPHFMSTILLCCPIMLYSGHHSGRTRYRRGGKFQSTVAIHSFSFKILVFSTWLYSSPDLPTHGLCCRFLFGFFVVFSLNFALSNWHTYFSRYHLGCS